MSVFQTDYRYNLLQALREYLYSKDIRGVDYVIRSYDESSCKIIFYWFAIEHIASINISFKDLNISGTTVMVGNEDDYRELLYSENIDYSNSESCAYFTYSNETKSNILMFGNKEYPRQYYNHIFKNMIIINSLESLIECIWNIFNDLYVVKMTHNTYLKRYKSITN